MYAPIHCLRETYFEVYTTIYCLREIYFEVVYTPTLQIILDLRVPEKELAKTRSQI